jgi:hypothetical protein
LEDGQTLKECKIINNSIINVVKKMEDYEKNSNANKLFDKTCESWIPSYRVIAKGMNL